MQHRFGSIFGGVAAVICALAGFSLDAAEADPKAFFEKDVRPLLADHCFKCHGAESKIRGNLNLMSRAGLTKGGDLGPAFDEKEPAKSLLLKAVEYKDDDLQMPPKGKLKDEQIATLRK